MECLEKAKEIKQAKSMSVFQFLKWKKIRNV